MNGQRVSKADFADALCIQIRDARPHGRYALLLASMDLFTLQQLVDARPCYVEEQISTPLRLLDVVPSCVKDMDGEILV